MNNCRYVNNLLYCQTKQTNKALRSQGLFCFHKVMLLLSLLWASCIDFTPLDGESSKYKVTVNLKLTGKAVQDWSSVWLLLLKHVITPRKLLSDNEEQCLSAVWICAKLRISWVMTGMILCVCVFGRAPETSQLSETACVFYCVSCLSMWVNCIVLSVHLLSCHDWN